MAAPLGAVRERPRRADRQPRPGLLNIENAADAVVAAVEGTRHDADPAMAVLAGPPTHVRSDGRLRTAVRHTETLPRTGRPRLLGAGARPTRPASRASLGRRPIPRRRRALPPSAPHGRPPNSDTSSLAATNGLCQPRPARRSPRNRPSPFARRKLALTVGRVSTTTSPRIGYSLVHHKSVDSAFK